MDQANGLLRRGLLLEYLTLGWNVVGAAVILAAAVAARSVALAGFGLDSLIEIGASVVVLWQLKGSRAQGGPQRERRALRLIGAAFFALALYVLASSSRSLWTQAHAATSPWGMAWLALTFVVMMALASGKARTGAQLNNKVLQTEARVTVVDAYLAGCVLIGVALNAALGWWWADPVASLVIVYYGFKEGFHAWAEGAPEG